jgi:glycosyltransferase involved in cell wall biosynthesis
MRVLIAANIVPFLPGGAEHHIEGLEAALSRRGHEVTSLRFPFTFRPPAAIASLMAFCEGLDVNAPNGQRVDRLISLQFPAYGLRHDDHRAWVMHQHRAAYELYDDSVADDEERRLRRDIHAFDDRVLGRIPRRFANSRRVAERLKRYNGLDSEPLYHPPAGADAFVCEPAQPYLFYPSRLESLKRQDLLIRAAGHLRSPVGILIAGDGGQRERYARLVDELGLHDRVRLLGHVSEAEKRLYYARCLAVFFGPYDEDYGYVTLEAMLSEKPVITCTDSGGPLELVLDEQTGLVVEPSPEAVAAAIDRLHAAPARARSWGETGGAVTGSSASAGTRWSIVCSAERASGRPDHSTRIASD